MIDEVAVVKYVKPYDKEYPPIMFRVPHLEKYDILKIGKCDFVPLYQVIDLMIGRKFNEE